jgi:hypothetical protein
MYFCHKLHFASPVSTRVGAGEGGSVENVVVVVVVVAKGGEVVTFAVVVFAVAFVVEMKVVDEAFVTEVTLLLFVTLVVVFRTTVVVQ